MKSQWGFLVEDTEKLTFLLALFGSALACRAKSGETGSSGVLRMELKLNEFMVPCIDFGEGSMLKAIVSGCVFKGVWGW